MNRTRRMRDKKLSRRLGIAFALLVFIFVFLYVGMLSRVTGQTRQILAVQKTIRELNASADNLNLSLSQYHNLDRIAVRAEQLGMIQPTQAQLRVINLPQLTDNSAMQSADNQSVEGIMD